jgi:hypothetical protein
MADFGSLLGAAAGWTARARGTVGSFIDRS